MYPYLHNYFSLVRRGCPTRRKSRGVCKRVANRIQSHSFLPTTGSAALKIGMLYSAGVGHELGGFRSKRGLKILLHLCILTKNGSPQTYSSDFASARPRKERRWAVKMGNRVWHMPSLLDPPLLPPSYPHSTLSWPLQPLPLIYLLWWVAEELTTQALGLGGWMLSLVMCTRGISHHCWPNYFKSWYFQILLLCYISFAV